MIIKWLLYIGCAITVLIFWYFFLYPFLYNQYQLRTARRLIKSVIKNAKDEETKKQLEIIKSKLDASIKGEKIGYDLKDEINDMF